MAAVAPVRALLAQADEGPSDPPLIVEREFVGDEHVDESVLDATVLTQQTHCRSLLFWPICQFTNSPTFVERIYLDREELGRDILRLEVLYWRLGYRSADIDTTVTRLGDDEVRVTFHIMEGPPTVIAADSVLYPGEVLEPRQVRRAMLIDAGQPLNLFALDSSITRLRHVLWDEGYAAAEIETRIPVNDTLNVAAVYLIVNPRWPVRIDSLTIRGNEAVSDETVRRIIPLAPGQLFRRSDLVEAQRALYSSNLFDRVEISVPDTGAALLDSTVHVVVALSDAPLRSVQVTGAFNTADLLQFEGSFTHYNFLGEGRRLRFSAGTGNLFAETFRDLGISRFETLSAGELDEEEAEPFLRPNWQASIDFTQPWFLSDRNSLGASAFAHRRSVPGLFVDRGFGGSATFTRQVVPRAPVSANYRFEQSEIGASDVYFCVNFGICDPEQVRAMQTAHRLAPVSLGGFIDRTTTLAGPLSGWRAQLDYEHASAWTASEFRYDRVYGEGAYHYPLGGERVLAVGARVGYVRANPSTAEALGIAETVGTVIHPRKRFYAGGSRSLRGYRENQFGPRILTIPAEELPQEVIEDCIGGELDGPSPQQCNASLESVPSDNFVPHPLGGTGLATISIEYRFPLVGSLRGAAFVDAGLVGVGGLQELAQGAGAITPGFGIRYESPIGPVRLDIGIRPVLVERLPVVTSLPGSSELVQLGVRKRYDPLEGASGLQKILQRLTLHLAIGEAF